MEQSKIIDTLETYHFRASMASLPRLRLEAPPLVQLRPVTKTKATSSREECLSRASMVFRDDLRLLSCFIPAACIMPRGGIKLAFDIVRTICLVIFALRFCDFLPICFSSTSAEPDPVHTSIAVGPTGDQDGTKE